MKLVASEETRPFAPPCTHEACCSMKSFTLVVAVASAVCAASVPPWAATIAVAWLADRTDDGEPTPAPEQLHRHTGCRNEARHFRSRGHRIEPRQMDVSAERYLGIGRMDALRSIRGALDVAPSCRV